MKITYTVTIEADDAGRYECEVKRGNDWRRIDFEDSLYDIGTFIKAVIIDDAEAQEFRTNPTQEPKRGENPMKKEQVFKLTDQYGKMSFECAALTLAQAEDRWKSPDPYATLEPQIIRVEIVHLEEENPTQ